MAPTATHPLRLESRYPLPSLLLLLSIHHIPSTIIITHWWVNQDVLWFGFILNLPSVPEIQELHFIFIWYNLAKRIVFKSFFLHMWKGSGELVFPSLRVCVLYAIIFAELWHPPGTRTMCPCGWRQVPTTSLLPGVVGVVWWGCLGVCREDLNENSRAECLPQTPIL